MITFPWQSRRSEAYQHQLVSRPAGVVMIFMRSRNAARGDNSIYCMIPDPFPSIAFGKGSATPDYSDPAFTRIRVRHTSPEILGFLTWSSHVIIRPYQFDYVSRIFRVKISQNEKKKKKLKISMK